MTTKPHAEYECVNTCTFNVPLSDGNTYNQYYKAVSESDNPSETNLEVPAGTVVSKHFVPVSEQAKKDRADQMECPEKYIQTKEQLSILADLMVKEGYFKFHKDAEASIKERAKEVGVDSEKLGDCSVEETRRIIAVDDLLSRAETPKEQRQILNKILKDGGVTKYYKGAEPAALAQMVYDNDLYTEK